MGGHSVPRGRVELTASAYGLETLKSAHSFPEAPGAPKNEAPSTFSAFRDQGSPEADISAPSNPRLST